MSLRITILTISIIATSLSAQIFSRVNKLSLSTDYIETIAESVQDDSIAFYSNFSSVEDIELDLPYMLKMQTEKQQFNWNFHGVIGAEGELPKLHRFGAVGSNISYSSPFIKSGAESVSMLCCHNRVRP